MAQVRKVSLLVDRYLDQTDFHVYLHPSKMEELGLPDYSIVRIKVKNSTKQIVASAVRGDINMQISTIQMNRCFRINLTAYLGQTVIVETLSKPLVSLDTVTLKPIDDTIEGITGNLQDIFTTKLDNIPLQMNFVIPVFTLHRIIEFKVSQISSNNVGICSNITPIIIKEDTVKRPEGMPRFDSISYDDIGGMEPQIRELRQLIEMPLMNPQIFDLYGIPSFRGILISAPSGCGKTLLSYAIHNESPLHFERIQGFDFLARTAEDAACIMRRLAEMVIQKAPAIVFVDDMDIIIQDQYINGKADKRLYLAFVAALDMMFSRPNIVVIGVTKDASSVPSALKNVKRFSHLIEIPDPGREKKTEILAKKARGLKISPDLRERIIEKSTTPEDIEIKVYEELLCKALELATTTHTDDKELISVNELSSLEIGSQIPSVRNNGSAGFGFSQPAQNHDGFDFGFGNRGSIGESQQNKTENTFGVFQQNNNNSSQFNTVSNTNNSPFANSNLRSSPSGGIDPFSTVPTNAKNPFGQQTQQMQQQPQNPFNPPPRNDPFASNQAQFQSPPGNANPFNAGANTDPFATPSVQNKNPYATSNDQDPFSVPPSAQQDLSQPMPRQPQPSQPKAKKGSKKSADPFAPRPK